MKDDKFFVDALSVGFEILTGRPNSVRFIPFLCFFAFYVTDPEDKTFFPFWCEAAKWVFIKCILLFRHLTIFFLYFRFFARSLDNSDVVNGFAHLLKIFRQIDQERQSKVIDFLSVSKRIAFGEFGFRGIIEKIILGLEFSGIKILTYNIFFTEFLVLGYYLSNFFSLQEFFWKLKFFKEHFYFWKTF